MNHLIVFANQRKKKDIFSLIRDAFICHVLGKQIYLPQSFSFHKIKSHT